jgi:hypothetical protein
VLQLYGCMVLYPVPWAFPAAASLFIRRLLSWMPPQNFLTRRHAPPSVLSFQHPDTMFASRFITAGKITV